MRGQQIHLYATHVELVALLDAVSARESISFVEAGLFDDASVSLIKDPKKLESFHIYLAFFHGDKVIVRPVPQVSGRIKYAVDQLENQGTISIHLGGECDGIRLLASHIGTTNASKASAKLFRLYADEVQRRFKRIKSFWVGPEAVSLLDQNWRLMPTVGSAQEYDLVQEPSVHKGNAS